MFLVGAVIVVGATEAFLKGLVGVAAIVGLSTFAITTILSGMEAENTAVGLASGGSGFSELALGAVFGGAIFLVCVALGVGAPLSTPSPPWARAKRPSMTWSTCG
jgi:cation:H+ antiporter